MASMPSFQLLNCGFVSLFAVSFSSSTSLATSERSATGTFARWRSILLGSGVPQRSGLGSRSKIVMRSPIPIVRQYSTKSKIFHIFYFCKYLCSADQWGPNGMPTSGRLAEGDGLHWRGRLAVRAIAGCSDRPVRATPASTSANSAQRRTRGFRERD